MGIEETFLVQKLAENNRMLFAAGRDLDHMSNMTTMANDFAVLTLTHPFSHTHSLS